MLTKFGLNLGAIGLMIAHRRRDGIFSQIRLSDGSSENVVNITVNPSIFRRSGRVSGVRIGIGKPELRVAHFRLISI